MAVAGPGTRVDIDRAERLTSEHLYVGKIVDDRQGVPHLLAFENRRDTTHFVGGIIDPCPVSWNRSGTALVLRDAPPEWRPDTETSSGNVYGSPFTP